MYTTTASLRNDDSLEKPLEVLNTGSTVEVLSTDEVAQDCPIPNSITIGEHENTHYALEHDNGDADKDLSNLDNPIMQVENSAMNNEETDELKRRLEAEGITEQSMQDVIDEPTAPTVDPEFFSPIENHRQNIEVEQPTTTRESLNPFADDEEHHIPMYDNVPLQAQPSGRPTIPPAQISNPTTVVSVATVTQHQMVDRNPSYHQSNPFSEERSVQQIDHQHHHHESQFIEGSTARDYGYIGTNPFDDYSEQVHHPASPIIDNIDGNHNNPFYQRYHDQQNHILNVHADPHYNVSRDSYDNQRNSALSRTSSQSASIRTSEGNPFSVDTSRYHHQTSSTIGVNPPIISSSSSWQQSRLNQQSQQHAPPKPLRRSGPALSFDNATNRISSSGAMYDTTSRYQTSSSGPSPSNQATVSTAISVSTNRYTQPPQHPAPAQTVVVEATPVAHPSATMIIPAVPMSQPHSPTVTPIIDDVRQEYQRLNKSDPPPRSPPPPTFVSAVHSSTVTVTSPPPSASLLAGVATVGSHLDPPQPGPVRQPSSMMLALQQEREQRRLLQQGPLPTGQGLGAPGGRPSAVPPPPSRTAPESALMSASSSPPVPPPRPGRVPSILTHSFDDIPAGTDLYHQLKWYVLLFESYALPLTLSLVLVVCCTMEFDIRWLQLH